MRGLFRRGSGVRPTGAGGRGEVVRTGRLDMHPVPYKRNRTTRPVIAQKTWYRNHTRTG